MERVDNYRIQCDQAKKLFLTYDQNEIISRCRLRSDEVYLYMRFLSETYRICRNSGDLQRLHRGQWVDGNSFGEVMTVLDWLCDSRPDRFITGRWVNIVTHGHYFHRTLQEDRKDPDAAWFADNMEAFAAACVAMKGEKIPGGDVSYAIELLDGLRILVQLWLGDEEFPPKVCCLWDENTIRFIRYETTWFAVGLLMQRIKENMEEILC